VLISEGVAVAAVAVTDAAVSAAVAAVAVAAVAVVGAAVGDGAVIRVGAGETSIALPGEEESEGETDAPLRLLLLMLSALLLLLLLVVLPMLEAEERVGTVKGGCVLGVVVVTNEWEEEVVVVVSGASGFGVEVSWCAWLLVVASCCVGWRAGWLARLWVWLLPTRSCGWCD